MNAQPATLIRRHRISVDDYHRMGETGVLAADARVEFIDGEVVDMAPIGSGHAALVNRLARVLQRAVADRALVSTQNPIRLGAHSEPQPDLALLKPQAGDYVLALPTAADALLIIEVSDSSAAYDLQVKAPLYARHDIPALWVIDLDAGTVRLFSRPHGSEYLEVRASPRPGTVDLPGLPGAQIDLDAIVQDLIA